MTLGWFFFYSVAIYTTYYILDTWQSYGML